jgi:hypothetical protein
MVYQYPSHISTPITSLPPHYFEIQLKNHNILYLLNYSESDELDIFIASGQSWRIMTSLPTSATASRSRLPLILPTLPRALVASNLLLRLLLSQNIVCILYSKYTSLTDTSLFSPPAFAKCFICLAKSTDLSS